MQTQTSEPGDQDLGQQIATKNILRLFFLPEGPSPGFLLPENLRAQCPPRRVLYVWLVVELWGRTPAKLRVGLT